MLRADHGIIVYLMTSEESDEVIGVEVWGLRAWLGARIRNVHECCPTNVVPQRLRQGPSMAHNV